MQRTYLALTTAALLSTTCNSHANSNITIYGKANITLNNIKEESKNPTPNEWQLNSNASRLGVKGNRSINNALDAIYKMEFEVNIDDGQSSSSKGSDTFEQRNIYAGFQGDFGTLIAGKHDTPLKLAQGKVDRFNDQKLADIKNIMEGEDRASNIVMYASPNMYGLSATVALIPGEDSTGESGNGGAADGTSYSLHYKNNWVNAAIARNNEVDSQDTTRIAADFKMENTQIGVLWQKAENIEDSDNERSWLLSTAQKISGNWKLKAQYGQTQYNSDDEDIQVSIGVDKKLIHNTKFFAYYTNIERKNITTKINDRSVGIGYEIKF